MQHSNASNAEVKRLLYLRGGKKKKKEMDNYLKPTIF